MKVIQSRIFIEKANEGSVIQDRTSLLVWFLSVLHWKTLGYEVVLYTDTITKDKFNELELLPLYDEVHILDNSDVNKEVFWACSKILAVKQFMEEHPNEEFILSDLDFIPFADPAGFVKTENDLVTFYRESYRAYDKVKNFLTYEELSKLPGYYKGNVDPVNTCLLYIQKSILNAFKQYVDYELKFMSSNDRVFESGSASNEIMVFLEQRLFAEYLVANNINIICTNPKYKSVFNINGIHTGPYKSIEKVEYWKWIIWYLKMLRNDYNEVYEYLIDTEMYSDIKQIIDNGGGEYINKKDDKTTIENFNWDTLKYPPAFEDIYDPIWNT